MYRFIKKYRTRLLVFLTHQMALPILKLIRKPEVFPYAMETLERMQQGTLGKDLFDFLTKRSLPLLPHYARHDIKHILLDYDTTEEGEVCLQCFMLGNRHISFPVLVTVVYGCITMPVHWKMFLMAYRRGKHAVAISDWKWFEILFVPTIQLKRQIASV